MGIVIAYDTSIGKNCTIHQGITLGRNFSGKHEGCPQIGNNVIIYPNAVITGNVKIGDYAVIAANSVVTEDVPPYSIVGGIPAKILHKNDPEKLSPEKARWFYPDFTSLQ